MTIASMAYVDVQIWYIGIDYIAMFYKSITNLSISYLDKNLA